MTAWSLLNLESGREPPACNSGALGAYGPDLRYRPALKIREGLSQGNLCMLVFERVGDDDHAKAYAVHRYPDAPHTNPYLSPDQCSGELMWARIRDRKEHPIAGKRVRVEYIGELASTPVVFGDVLRHGEFVTFGPEHVLRWEVG